MHKHTERLCRLDIFFILSLSYITWTFGYSLFAFEDKFRLNFCVTIDVLFMYEGREF